MVVEMEEPGPPLGVGMDGSPSANVVKVLSV